jgi:pimeloyl-ACP methyl ester carboxylesterase
VKPSPPKSHQVEAADGWVLKVAEPYPVEDPVAVVLCLHAMMVDGRTFTNPNRANVCEALAQHRFRVLVPDLRGHGCSGPTVREGGSWTYDELVEDMDLLIALASRLAKGVPVHILGHSLGGHVALAYLGRHRDVRVAKLVLMGVNIWGGPWEPHKGRLFLKRLSIRFWNLAFGLVGYVPARRTGVGSADESSDYWSDISRFILSGTWTSRDGWDYYASLSEVEPSILQIISDGDRYLGYPLDGLQFLEPLASRRTVLHLGSESVRSELDGLTPEHMAMVTDCSSSPLWEEMARWLCVVDGKGLKS